MKKWSLRVQITVAVGLIVTAACVILTLNSIYSASSHYMQYFGEEAVQKSLQEEKKAKEYEIDGKQEETDGQESGTGQEETGDYASDMMEVDEVTIADAMQSFSHQGLEIMVLTVAASLLFTWWATGKLIKPLEQLTDTIQKIDDGTLNQSGVPVRGTREVRQLADSFNGMLERLDGAFQMQKRFAADAAHELKTPIAGMKASLQVLQMDEKPEREEYEEFVQDADECLGRLSQTVDSLLAMAGNSRIREEQPVELILVIEKVLDDLKDKAGKQCVALSMEAEEGTEAVVQGSPALFGRVIYNVVENAIKYNKAGGSVRVHLYKKEHMACVEVADTGRGISQESLDKIFQPFYREDPSRSQEIEGSGLGLAIVKSVMERYHGTVTAKSEVGKGTIIQLEYPLWEKGV